MLKQLILLLRKIWLYKKKKPKRERNSLFEDGCTTETRFKRNLPSDNQKSPKQQWVGLWGSADFLFFSSFLLRCATAKAIDRDMYAAATNLILY
jgi:hypothetical protein